MLWSIPTGFFAGKYNAPWFVRHVSCQNVHVVVFCWPEGKSLQMKIGLHKHACNLCTDLGLARMLENRFSRNFLNYSDLVPELTPVNNILYGKSWELISFKYFIVCVCVESICVNSRSNYINLHPSLIKHEWNISSKCWFRVDDRRFEEPHHDKVC